LILTVALVVSLSAAIIPEAGAAHYGAAFGSGLWWDLDTATGALSITSTGVGTGSMYYFGAAGAPWYPYREVIRTVSITGAVANIAGYAFAGCINMTGIAISDTVTTIGDSAFDGCANLASIDIPVAVTNIGETVFTGCRSLGAITIGGTAGVTADGSYAVDASGVLREFIGSYAPRIIKAPVGIGAYTIESNIVKIDAEAFAYSRLTSIIIPESVNTIGRDAFSWSVLLQSATFNGNAPQYLPYGDYQLFDNAGAGFVIYYYPYTSWWPAPPSTNWRGYTAIAMTSYVTLDRSVASLETGKTTRLQATVYPLNSSQAVTWSSDNPAVAIVTAEGVVHGLTAGAAVITATSAGGETATCRMQIVSLVVPVSNIVLNKSSMTLSAGGVSDTLVAVVYPLDATNKTLYWSSSDTNVAYVGATASSPLQRLIVPVSPGSAIIEVRTADGGMLASCTVTVTGAPIFVPVSYITLSTSTVAAGSVVNLSELAAVQPANATNKYTSWALIDQTTTGVTLGTGGMLTVPLGQSGTITVEATVKNGLAEVVSGDGTVWGYPEDIDYIQRYTISVVPFIPVTQITDVPNIAFAGVPLQLKGTVNPINASFKTIEWGPNLDTNTAGAYLDPVTGVLTAQWPGTVSVTASVRNGRMSGVTFEQTFVIRVDPYTTYSLDLRANPGGTVSGAAGRQFAGGEVVDITAIPSMGYIFAGWYSTNGGEFADPSRTTTQFTMPGNATSVYAYFTYIGLPAGGVGGGGGGVVLPTPVQYFTNNSIYIRNTSVSFGHITVRDFSLFSYVTVDGRTLTRNAQYTANRSGGSTEIVLANGYLNALSQGAHTLTVYFADYVSVSAVFTVLWEAQTSQSYDDVYTSDWFYVSVAYVSERGWMTSRASEPKKFRPSDFVTQGEVIDAMYRMAGSPSILNMYGQPLQGRDASLEWVRSNSILPLGGIYNLNSAITRQDIAVLFTRLVSVLRLRLPVVQNAPSFADDWQIDSNARASVINLFRAGVIGGRTVNTFVPLGNMTRAECAAVLQRFADALGNW